MLRSKEINKIDEDNNFDVIVIGGGASGLGTALDATTRGYKTVCLEAYDFAKGTSSRSTKLVHGGVRYLGQGDVGLVKEALRERGLLAQNAAHLVKNQTFVIPNYTWWGGGYYRFGLGVYDLLSAGLSLGKSKQISKESTIRALPTIETKDLHGGVIYKDGQFDDSRLAINIAQTVVNKGGSVINYIKVVDLIKDENNLVKGVVAKDMLANKEYKLYSKTVINATGVFADDILKMNKPSKSKRSIVPSQGVHLVLDKSFLPSDHALMIPKTSDGRVLFAVPWHGKLIVGTTDTLIDKESVEPVALEEEVQFILDTACQFLTKKPTREDVYSVYAGLRPLAAPKDKDTKTKEVSRSHKIITSKTGLISILGGKWTTYRQIAEDAVDKAIKKGQLEQRTCVTTHLSIHGNTPKDQVDRTNRLYIYGTDSYVMEYYLKEHPEFKERLHPNHKFLLVEVIWAIREEMAHKIEDILARRVRLLFLDARAAIDVAEKVARILSKELDKDEVWITNETNEFIALAQKYLLVPYQADKNVS